MSLEAATYLNDLVATNPVVGDAVAQGDDHIRLMKNVLKATFPNMGGRFGRTQSKSSNYTALAADDKTVIVFTVASTLSLTAAATLGSGWSLSVIAEGVQVTIDPNGAETINNVASLILPANHAATIMNTGIEFFAFVYALDPSNIQMRSLGGVATAGTITVETADGADTQSLTLSGGGFGGDSRAATIILYGNENAQTGQLLLQSGNVAGAVATLQSDSVSLVVAKAGTATIARSTGALAVRFNTPTDLTFELSSDNIVHSLSDFANSNSFALIQKHSAGTGGVRFTGAIESAGSGPAIVLEGIGVEDNTRSTSAFGMVEVRGFTNDGTATKANPAGNRNLMVVRQGTTTRFILDSDGDSHQDVGTAWTNFDFVNDVATLDALAYNLARPGDIVREKFGEIMLEAREGLERLGLVKFNKNGRHFANMSKLTMLNTGAIRQVSSDTGKELAALRSEIEELRQQIARPWYKKLFS